MQIRGAQARLNFAKDQISTDKHLVELVQQRLVIPKQWK